MTHANIRNNTIIDFNSLYLDEDITRVETTEEMYNAWLKNKDKVIYQNGEVIINPDYEKQKQEEERHRLDNLSMTRSDFFDATIMAFGADENDLLTVLSNLLATIPLSNTEKKIALNNYKNALNFYRKHTLFTLLSGVEIPITETMYLVFTSDIWDKFFDTKDYKELQKAIQVKPELTESEVE